MPRAAPEKIAQARQLRKRGLSWVRIAKLTGLHKETCRLNVDPVARATYNSQQRAWRGGDYKSPRFAAGIVEDYPFRLRRRADHDAAKQVIPPAEWTDLTAYQMGDPVIGRRALDMRQRP